MRTSLSLLPAINSLYDIGLTPKHIKDLSNQSNFIEGLLVHTNDYQNWDTLRNNFRYMIKTKGMMVEVHPFTASGSTGKIEIEKISDDPEKRDASFSDAMYELAENSAIFVFDADRYSSHKNILSFKTINEKTLKLLDKYLSFKKVFKFDKIPAWDVSIKNMFTSRVIDTNKQFEQLMRDYFSTTASLQSYIPMEKIDSVSDFDSFCVLIDFLYPGASTTKVESVSDTINTIDKHTSLNAILKIWELNNERHVLYIKSSQYSYNGNNAYFLRADPNHAAYNYLDVGRFSSFSQINISNAEEGQEFGNIIYSDLPPTLPVKEVLNASISELARGKEDDASFALVNNATLRLLSKRYDQRQARKHKDEKAKEALEKKIQSKIDILKEKDNPRAELKINNVTFKPYEVEYEGQILSFDTDEFWVYRMVSHLIRRWSFNDINFDMAFDYFLSKSGGFDSGKVGDVTFKVERRANTNVNGVTSYLTYINNCRINASELEDCIRRGLCYEKQDDFDFFLKAVSTCSLELHKYLDLGIQLSLHDYFEGVSVKAKLPIERTKNINYLVLGEKEYRIRNTQRLIRLENQNELLEAITTLLNPDVVTGIQPEDIKELIADAKEEYVSAVEKSKKLLEETEKVFKIKQEHVTLGNGDRKYGYIVAGKMRQYFIELHETNIEKSSCRVYDFETGDYFCIVDKSTNTQVGMDKVVNRVYALHNDSLLATEIHTLNRNT